MSETPSTPSDGASRSLSGSILSPELLIVIVVTVLSRTLGRVPKLCERLIVGIRLLDSPHVSTLVDFLRRVFVSPDAATAGRLTANSLALGQELLWPHMRPLTYSYFPAASHALVWTCELPLAALQTASIAALVAAATCVPYVAYELLVGGAANPLHLHVCLTATAAVSVLSNAPHLLDGLAVSSSPRAVEVYISAGVGALAALLSLLLQHNFNWPLHALVTGVGTPSTLQVAAVSLPIAAVAAAAATAHALAWLRLARSHFDLTRMSCTFLPPAQRPSELETLLSMLAFAAPFLSLAALTSTVIPAPLALVAALAVSQLAALRLHLQAFASSALRRVLEHFYTAAAAAAPRSLTLDPNPLSPAALQVVLDSCGLDAVRVKLGLLNAALQLLTPPVAVLALSVLAAHAAATATAAQRVIEANAELWETLDAALGPQLMAIVRLLANGEVVHHACVHILIVILTSACLVQTAGLAYWEYLANRAALPKPAAAAAPPASDPAAPVASAETADADATVRRRR